MKMVKDKVTKIATNTVQTCINNMVADRHYIKKILVITIDSSGVYRVSRSLMSDETAITMSEVAKRKAIKRLFGE